MTNRKERHELEAALETGEVIADVDMRGDVMADVPIIGTAFKALKAIDSIRDRAFAAKLSRFLLGLEKMSDETREKLQERLRKSPEEMRHVGETLLLIVERVTDLDKPTLLAQIFVAYVDGVVSSADLRRLCQAVDAAFPDDLEKLLQLHKVPQKSRESWMQFMNSSGLTRAVGGETYDEIGKVFYELTPLANKLRTAYYHGRKFTVDTSATGQRNLRSSAKKTQKGTG